MAESWSSIISWLYDQPNDLTQYEKPVPSNSRKRQESQQAIRIKPHRILGQMSPSMTPRRQDKAHLRDGQTSTQHATSGRTQAEADNELQ
jgi:hypothetical protein